MFEKFKKLFTAYSDVIKIADDIILNGNKSRVMEYKKARIDLAKVKNEVYK